MSNDHLEEHHLDQLLREFGLSPEATAAGSGDDVPVVRFVRTIESPPDDREQRILDRSERWIRFLNEQSERLTNVASALYQQLTAPESPALVPLRDDVEADSFAIIDRLEWALSALQSWIEGQRPRRDGGRFRVRWSGDDGLAYWGLQNEEWTVPVSLHEVVRDVAETEGAFAPDVAHHIAALVVKGLRSGGVRLLRVRPVEDESTPDETVFELLARGEAYLASIAMADEADSVMMEVEARLGEGSAAVRLASLVDTATYGAARAAAAGAPLDRALASSVDLEMAERIDHVADACHLRRDDALKCLLFVATRQLDEAMAANDQAAAHRLARTVRDLAAVVLSER